MARIFKLPKIPEVSTLPPVVKKMSVRNLLLKAGQDHAPNSYLSKYGSQHAILRSDQRNRILVYCGAFNPPHVGHYDCLVDSLTHVVGDTAISGFVTAIVAPLDDFSVRLKEEKRRSGAKPGMCFDDPVFLSCKERVDLFSEHVYHPKTGLDPYLRSKVQVWAPGKLRGIGEFAGPLAAAAAAEGFELEFIVLRSPEYLHHDPNKRRNPHDFHPLCNMVLYSQAAGRDNPDIWRNDGGPRDFELPWSPWLAISRNENRGGGVCRTVWCTRSGKQEQRLLHTRNIVRADAKFSSTQIRKILSESQGDSDETCQDTIRKLRAAGAVSPEWLVRLVVHKEFVDARWALERVLDEINIVSTPESKVLEQVSSQS